MTSISPEPMADLLVEWLKIDSTSGNEASFLEVLERFLSEQGFTITRQNVAPERWNLIAQTEEPADLIFSTHVDTVPPFLPVRYEDGVVYGRGACDTKGGIVAMLQAGVELLAEGHRNFGYLFVVGEEVDHCGAKAAQELDVAPSQIILCEPTCNRIVSAQKGMLRVELRSQGVAGHSAYPERGVSAINRLLDALERIRAATWPEHDVLGRTTLNIGVLEGGVAANVFAPAARAEILFRAVSEVDALLKQVRDCCGDDAEIRVLACNDPVFFEPPEGFETCIVPFNTDATYLADLGPVWLVGPGNIKHAHADHEHIVVADLKEGFSLYRELALKVLT